MSHSQEAFRLVVADDSMLYQHLLKKVLSADPDLEVVGVAKDGQHAVELYRTQRPDAVVLDLNMPRLNGFEVLDVILTEGPVPVVMISAGAAHDGDLAVQAVARGAIDLFPKPSGSDGQPPSTQLKELGRIVVQACRSRIRRRDCRTDADGPCEGADGSPLREGWGTSEAETDVVVVGASTGGIGALDEIIQGLGPRSPPIVVAQHMPQGYTGRLADQLRKSTRLEVVESSPRLEVKPGRLILCAADDEHTVVQRVGSKLRIEKSNAPKEHHHRPAVDPLFRSVADVVGSNSLGILLTGMGRDGASGLLALLRSGATTIAESEATATIFGMPKAAIEIGAAQHVMSLSAIGQVLREREQRSKSERPRRELK